MSLITEEPKEDSEFHCTECSYKTWWSFAFLRHMKIHHSNLWDCGKVELLKCFYCDFTTFFKLALKDHLQAQHEPRDCFRSHSKSSEYRCLSCTGFMWTHSVLFLVNHRCSSFSLACPKCRHKSKSQDDLQHHLIKVHNCMLVKCQWCSFEATNMRTFKNHLRLLHNEEMQQLHCTHCKFTAMKFSLMVLHILRKHISKQDMEVLHCTKCSYKSQIRKNLQQHISNKHDKKRKRKIISKLLLPLDFKCKECSYETTCSKNLTEHIIHKHTPDSLIDWHYCTQCSFKGKTISDLQYHRRKHTAEEVCCPHCPYKTKYPKVLKSHIRNRHLPHTDVKWFPCDQCDYKSRRNGDLKTHKLCKHTDDKNFTNWIQCEQCDHKTKMKHHMTQHVLRKHKLKEMECCLCPFKTKYVKRFDRHLKNKHMQVRNSVFKKCQNRCGFQETESEPLDVHSKECPNKKVYSCDLCDYQTPRASHLTRHKDLKHFPDNLPVHCCKLCKYESKCEQYLVKHVVINHTGGGWSNCKQCKFKTKVPWFMESHLKTHANNQNITT